MSCLKSLVICTTILGSVAVSLPAAAEEPAAPPSEPCKKAPSSIRLGGIDLDEMSCTLYLAQQRSGQSAMLADRMQAKLILLNGELVETQKRIADLDAYAKACGDKPGCFVAPDGATK